MEADTTQAQAHYFDGLDLLAQERCDEAAAAFRAAVAADPAMADARHGLIRALRDLHAYDEAIREATQLATDEPEDVLALTALSILYQHQGLIAEAEATATRAKLLDWKLQLRASATRRAE